MHNEPFASIFFVENSGTLYEGINSPVFELYLFQEMLSNFAEKKYKIIDSLVED